MIAEATPLLATKCTYVHNGDILALLERCYRTTDRYGKQQATDLASRFARGSVAIASACLAGVWRFRVDHSTMHL